MTIKYPIKQFLFLLQSATTFPSVLHIETSGQADRYLVYDPTGTVKDTNEDILRNGSTIFGVDAKFIGNDLNILVV